MLRYSVIPVLLGLGLSPAYAVSFNTDFLYCPGAPQCLANGEVLLTLNALGTAEPITSANPLPTTGGGGGGAVTQSGVWNVGPSVRTVIPMDVSGVATSGTAVNVLSAGHATAGGFLVTSNAAGMCVDQFTTAQTITSGTTVCVLGNQRYDLVPTTGAVSVNSTASGVVVAGNGLN